MKPDDKNKKRKKIEELNLTTTNEALEEIEAEIGKQKLSLGQELIEGLEDDSATKDLVHRAVAVADTVFFKVILESRRIR